MIPSFSAPWGLAHPCYQEREGRNQSGCPTLRFVKGRHFDFGKRRALSWFTIGYSFRRKRSLLTLAENARMGQPPYRWSREEIGRHPEPNLVLRCDDPRWEGSPTVSPSLSPTHVTNPPTIVVRSRFHAGYSSGGRPRAASAALAFAVMLVCVVFATPGVQAQTYAVLYAFCTNSNDGVFPVGDLVFDNAGNLYGTTDEGGMNGGGTVFKLTKAGKESVLHNFGSSQNDGSFPGPYSGLIRDAGGNLYGTTGAGGGFGYGTVFEVDSTGRETVLYSFAGGRGDGSYPYSGVIRDATGSLYGTTAAGGGSDAGTVFRLDSTGKETVLYSFGGPPDGLEPEGGLVRDAAGNFYGTTINGGAFGGGTVFKIDAAGKETILHSFSGYQGRAPTDRLVLDAAGNLYGTAEHGTAEHLGTLFKLDPNGKLSVLHRFAGQDGALPLGGLTRDASGNLYGTTERGGNPHPRCKYHNKEGCGVVFKRNPTGNETVLYSFPGDGKGPGIDGGLPTANLVRDAAGSLYGTTIRGGNHICSPNYPNGAGVVFKITP
jgi:uncharacterized repeat protein (TIGR03803 family)